MVGVFLSSVFKALKQKCFNSKIISSTTLGCISRPTSCRTLSVPGSSVSPAASTAGHRSTWTREFELSQVNCKTYLAFVNPSSVVNSDPSFNPHSFVVHGFRPLPKTPNFNEVFDAEVEGEWLKKQLSPIWRALNGEGSSSYWYYQSTHQGGFQDVFLSQYEYFNAVIKLYPKYNMLMILATADTMQATKHDQNMRSKNTRNEYSFSKALTEGPGFNLWKHKFIVTASQETWMTKQKQKEYKADHYQTAIIVLVLLLESILMGIIPLELHLSLILTVTLRTLN